MANVNLGIQVIWTGDNVTAELGGVEARMESLGRAVDRLGNTFQRSMRRQVLMIGSVEVGIERLTRQVGFLMRSFRNAAAVTAIVGAAMFAFGRVLLDATGKYQRFVQQLTISEGSGQAATQMMLDITRQAVDLGASIEGTIDMYSRLRLVGVEGARDLSLAINGLAATAGLTTDQIGRVTLAVTQMFSKGTFVRAEEFNTQLQETLPLAARAAAEGFRRMGNTALDSVDEIQRAVDAGTLAVTEFTSAIVLGSDAFINSAAAITNASVQWDGLLQVIQLAIGAQGHMTGATAAFGIVMNAATKAILDYVVSWEQLSPEQRAQQVAEIVDNIINFVSAIETAIRVVVALGRIVTGISRAIFDAIVLIMEPLVALGGALAAITSGNFQDVPRFWTALQRAMGTTFREIGNGINSAIRGADELASRATPIADALRRQVSQMDIPAIVAAAGNAGPQNAQGESSAEQTDAAAQRRANRLVELQEQVQRLSIDAQQVSDRAMSPLDDAMSRARGPIDELIHRFRDLRTDFQALAQQGAPVGDTLSVIDAQMQSLAASADQAAERATALYVAQQRVADLRNLIDVNKVQNQVRDLVESVTVRFESEGAEQVRVAEQGLADTRRSVSLQIAELDAQIVAAQATDDAAEIARLETVRGAHIQYQEQLGNVTGAMQVAAARMREMVGAIRSSVEGAVSNLIQGLVGTQEFDFDQWASQLVTNITAAIADNWAKKITDTIFGFLGMDNQTVNRMTVQSMTVLGGGGKGGGDIVSGIGSLFGGGGKGGGDLMSTLMSIAGMFFSRGGVKGLLSGPLAGSVTPFARGGITGGPTLFGMAGEKGKEGILPLERIGGKLGVNATGGGGMNATIVIQAIDTQTGAMFIKQNADQIVGQLQAQMALGNFRR